MECGRDAAIAISSTQNVYQDEAEQAARRQGLAPALKASVDELDGAITLMASLTKGSVQQAAVQALQISNSLPYLPSEPRLAKITPQFLVPSKGYLVKLRFNGAFEAAAKPAFFPTLTIQTHSYKPIASAVGEIEFSVPIGDVFPQARMPRRCSLLQEA